MIDMDPRVREMWVKALRSGEYTQTKSVLHARDDGGYCCLGVLCDLAVKEGAIPAPRETATSGDYRPVYEYGPEEASSYASLPPAVARWAGLDEDNSDPQVGHMDDTEEPWFPSAASLNDDFGYTFAMIADAIEAEVIPAVDL